MSPARASLIVKSVVTATFILSAAFLLFCLWFGQSQQRAGESQRPAHTQQHAAQNEPGGVPSPHAGQTGDGRQQNQSDASKWSEPLTFLTLLLVVGNFVIAGIYVYQLRYMRKTVAIVGVQGDMMRWQFDAMKEQAGLMRDSLTETKSMVKQNERIVAASEIQAKAAEQNAAAVKESFYISERPYVFITDAKLVSPLSSGKYPGTFLRMVNTGKTPALNLKFLVISDALADSRRENAQKGVMPIVPDSMRPPSTSTAVLGAGVYFTQRKDPRDWNVPEVGVRILNGEATFYVWGEVRYSDIFGRRHFTTFCMHAKDVNKTELTISPHGNDMDTE
jgi:hypothetical protein